MNSYAQLWQSPAGLALFLLGIQMLEASLNKLSGRRFKLFLKKHAAQKLKAIGGGAIITAILQSSSVVNLLVLAFVGAGVLQMQHALALILGANLGTTFNSWLIASVGFAFNIYQLALPFLAIGGIFYVSTNREKSLHNWSRMLLAVGFLFTGLSLIRDGISGLVTSFDLSALNNLPAIVFLLAGFFITSLLQFSSAAMAIALSALFANAISFQIAMAFTLGAEIGTSTKLLLASLKGSSSKKRVALGSIIFNIIPAFLFLFMLGKTEYFLMNFLGIGNKLLALAAFQSLVNLTAILLFLPFLKTLGLFLQNRFKEEPILTQFIHPGILVEEELAEAAFYNETALLTNDSIDFMASCFHPAKDLLNADDLHSSFKEKTLQDKYDFIKKIQNQLREYHIKLQTANNEPGLSEKRERLITAARNAMYAAKSMKDNRHDIDLLNNSSNNIKYNSYKEGKDKTIAFCNRLLLLKNLPTEAEKIKELENLYRELSDNYSQTLEKLYKESWVGHLNDTEVSTLINFNRQLATAHKSIFFAVTNLHIHEGIEDRFNDLPGFIH